MSGVNEVVIQKLMRHESIASTLVYTKFSDAYLKAASERITYGPHRVK
jgi:site-specific recombinase XerD